MISSLISTSDLNNRRVLFLSSYKAAVYHWHRGAIGSSYLFDVNEEGRQAFERYLQETPNEVFYILVDVYEEEYKRETIPHVFGADRKALLTRKINRLFHDTEYVNTEVRGREERGRRDDRIFLSAITSPDLIAPWVKLLDKYKAPLAGINSLPLFTQSMLGLFAEESDQILVVSLQSISGLRQTFFYKKEFRVSRLVQMPRYGSTSYVPHITEEVEKIMRYLNSLRLTTEDSALDIYFLLAGDLLVELKQALPDSHMIRHHFLDLNALLTRSGLDRRVTTPFSDQLFINEYLKKPPGNRYATDKDRRYFNLRRLRLGMIATGVALILGCSLWTGLNVMDALVLKQGSLAAEQKTRFYTDRYEEARSRLPHTPVEPGELKVAVDIAQTLNDYKGTPLPTVQAVSKALDRFPAIRLDTVEWLASTNPNQVLGGGQPQIGA
ncbi:MAG TPA: hypothetical protein VJN91_07380, partial [Gammaproteobacteria bacterium]|nr:hypothetical protein [Gammaproteobacteria bacterium]